MNLCIAGLVARGRHWLILSSLEDAPRRRRTLQQLLNDPPLLAFGAVPQQLDAVTTASSTGDSPGGGLRRSLSLTGGRIMHSAVHLLTLQRSVAVPRRLLVRLAHLYEEDESLGKPFTETLGTPLEMFRCQGPVAELSLSGNQLRAEAEAARLRFKGEEGGEGARAAGQAAAGDGPLSERGSTPQCVGQKCGDQADLVTLHPMEIRTFELDC